jgi:hypothetical protein
MPFLVLKRPCSSTTQNNGLMCITRTAVGYDLSEYYKSLLGNSSLNFVAFLHVVTARHNVFLCSAEQRIAYFYGTRRFIKVSTSCHEPLYPQPDASSPHLPNPNSLRSILILSSPLHLCFPSGLRPSSFPTKCCNSFSYLPCVPHALPISSCLIRSP